MTETGRSEIVETQGVTEGCVDHCAPLLEEPLENETRTVSLASYLTLFSLNS